MQIIECKGLKEKLYIKELENGLKIMFIPKKNSDKKYIVFGTNYGSIDNHFKSFKKGEIVEVPDGIAHFLEHKMFEQENGKNSLDVLSSLGVNPNAYTTNNYTAYLYECLDNFYLALDEFMDYIQNPYFTDENVEKEKGIIEQEIAMYDDYPEWRVYINILKALYKDNQVRIDIAGTKESISKITKETLYECYDTFYHLSNMVIVVCGDFEPDEIFENIEKRFKKTEKREQIDRIYKEEQEQIVKDCVKQKMDVNMPLFIIGIKDKIETENIVQKHIAINIILNLLIGKSSGLYKKLYDEGLIITSLEFSYEFAKTYSYILIQGQSKEPEKINKYFKEEIETLKNSGINNENFNRIRKMLYGEFVKEFNNVQTIGTNFISDYFKGINTFEYLEEYKNITIEYTEKILNEVFDTKKMAISIVN